MKTYSELINVLLVVPDYALSHALSALLLNYVHQRQTQIQFNFGKETHLTHNVIATIPSYYEFFL